MVVVVVRVVRVVVRVVRVVVRVVRVVVMVVRVVVMVRVVRVVMVRVGGCGVEWRRDAGTRGRGDGWWEGKGDERAATGCVRLPLLREGERGWGWGARTLVSLTSPAPPTSILTVPRGPGE